MPFFVYILSFGAFVLGTSEFMVAGMMPSLMEAFSISEEMAGGLVSLYALGMVVGGPVLAGVLTLVIPHNFLNEINMTRENRP